MQRENNSMLMVMLLLFSGVMYTQIPGRTGAPVGEPREKSAAKSAAAAPEATGLQELCGPTAERLVAEFFTSASPLVPGSDLRRVAQQHGYNVEFLVATVPDPLDSGSGWLFDRYVDAIERAVAATEYLLDRHSFPWECAREARKQCAEKGGEPTDACRLASLHRRQPGVLLFRRPGKHGEKPGELLVVYLVGETPTWGVHKPALKRALDAACPVRDGHGKCPQEIRLLAPTFSGSAESLRIAIEEWSRLDRSLRPIPINPNFRIISGSASDYANKATLDPLSVGGFHATTVTSEAEIETVVKYFERWNVDACRVAMLKEANTAYGRGVVRGEGWGDACLSLGDSSGGVGGGGRRGVQVQDWLVLPFPSNISQVRSAYERGKSRNPAANGDLPRAALEFSLEEGEAARDVPPAQSPRMTSNTDDLVLASILSTISRERIQYVGILATDVRDTLFLAEQIRRYCPDVRLFTVSSDLLYTHPDHSSALEGMLVASSYPLFSKNQMWTDRIGGRHLRQQFSDSGSEGTYNATLALLDKRDWLVDYATPFTNFEHGHKRRPPVWLTVVGRGDLWPLMYRDAGSYSHSDYVFGAGGGDVDTRKVTAGGWGQIQSGFARVLIALISLFCLLNCAGYFYAVVASWYAHRRTAGGLAAAPDGARVRRTRHWRVLDVLRPPRRWRQRREHALYVAVGFVALLLAYASLARLVFLVVKFEPSSTPDIEIGKWTVTAKNLDCATMIVAQLCMRALVVASIVAVTGVLRPSLSRPLANARRWLRWFGVGLHGRRDAVGVFVGVSCVALSAAVLDWWLRVLRMGVASPKSIVPSIAAELARIWPVGLPGQIVERLSWWVPTDFPQLFLERAGDVLGGVSPLAPLLCLGAGWYVWSFCHLRRLRFLRTLVVPNPLLERPSWQLPSRRLAPRLQRGADDAGLEGFESWVVRTARSPWRWGLPLWISTVVIVLVGVVPCAWLWRRCLPSFEGPGFDALVQIGFALLYGGVALAFLQFMALWYQTRRLLRRLTLHPMIEAYSALPNRISQKLHQRMFAHVPTVTELGLPIERWRALVLKADRIAEDLHRELNAAVRGANKYPQAAAAVHPGIVWSQFSQNMEKAEMAASTFAQDLESAARQWGTVRVTRSVTQQLLSQGARSLVKLLEVFWRRGPIPGRPKRDDKTGDHGEATKHDTSAPPNPLGEVGEWLLDAEDFVAIQVVTFLTQTFVHLRNLMVLTTIGALLLLLTITAYPFQPQRLLLLFIWVVILTIVGGVVMVFVQMNRNEVLSRITHTKPNKVSFDASFLSSILTYGVLPVLTLLATMFPQIGGLWSVLEPLTRVFK
ncbi:MAG: hypothetical protein HYR72_16955 [Deltaproteobacteria bacterium]|nr:hypothetical protein [Deltaproteobacteria bacterium]MBI3389844.1 hypothetical protein [Deltaproteobacteria bacterium]